MINYTPYITWRQTWIFMNTINRKLGYKIWLKTPKKTPMEILGTILQTDVFQT